MKSYKKVILYISAISCFLLQSCKKDNPEPIDDGGITTEKIVTASVNGVVKDESGNPVSGASVKLGSNTTSTDINGLFFFHNVITPERISSVVVSKAGYFHGSRTFFVREGGKSTVRIRLMAKGEAESFVASSGGAVVFAGGLNITFPANSIMVKSNGVEFTGQVNVYAKKIDPTTQEGRESMPGDLRGINTDGEERLLQSFGMFVAELYDNFGNPLQIKEGSSATMSLAVPSSLLASAPGSIPLWYFDENSGIWKEEGNATLQGGSYVGEVSHFSFWNCDTPAAAIDLQMKLVDQNGKPLQNAYVHLINTTNQDIRSGCTDNNGWVGGLVYSNASLQMEVMIYGCSMQSYYSQTLNTGSSDMDLGTLTIDVLSSNLASISATIVNCEGNGIQNGAIYFDDYGIFASPDSNGNVSCFFPCTSGLSSTSVTLYNWDNGTMQNGTYPMVDGQNNWGIIEICEGEELPFFTMTITNDVTNDYEAVSTAYPSDSVYAFDDGVSITLQTASAISNQTWQFNLNVLGNAVGTYEINDFILQSMLPTNLPDLGFVFVIEGSTCTFTNVPVMGFLEGNFTAHLQGINTGQDYTVTGTFKIPKN